eukprot:1142859-Pelagomonas_calceolata.AAC.4
MLRHDMLRDEHDVKRGSLSGICRLGNPMSEGMQEKLRIVLSVDCTCSWNEYDVFWKFIYSCDSGIMTARSKQQACKGRAYTSAPSCQLLFKL